MAGSQSVFSVGQINTYIKNMFTQDYLLSRVSVKGEVSNCKYHPKGHIYFTLKDDSGTLESVMFVRNRGGLSFSMKNGDKVVVSGSIDVYERDGKYRLYAKQIALQGQGELYQRFERLKRELEEMGMFSQEYKRPIPKYIRTLGIVTASTGAAVKDIMNITRRRNPYVQMILYPVLVQGEGAAESIAEGIRILDAYGVDTMIVGRGGGSVENLWAFNEETVARAIFNCSTPIISAVGHEIDTTIADLVADLRAPTPSAAAELAVYDYRQTEAHLADCRARISRRMEKILQEYRQYILNYQYRLENVSPENQLREKQQRLADAQTKLESLMADKILKYRHRLALLAEKLHGLSPLQKLRGGYGYVTDSSGKALKSTADLAVGDSITVQMSDGRIKAQVTEKYRNDGEESVDHE